MWRPSIAVVFLFCAFVDVDGQDLSPDVFAKRATDQIIQHPLSFFTWHYGGAIVLDGMVRVNKTFSADYIPTVYKYLDIYTTDPNSQGYKILHNITIPFFHNVGDDVPLFSANYLSRYLMERNNPDYDSHTDWTVTSVAAMYYTLQYPKTLPDGTFTRNYGWMGETNDTNTYLWCDDMYMGLTLLARLVQFNATFADFTAKQIISFTKYLQDPSDGLFLHGANAENGHQNCCKWGRANGWAFMAEIEVLAGMKSMKNTYKNSKVKEDVLSIMRRHADGICKNQSPDGRWHQVVNETSTFLETSASAMFVSGLSRAVVEGWLPGDTFGPCINAGWKGLNKVISSDGSISGICNGLGVGATLSHYEECDQSYLGSGNGGLGSVLYAAADYQKFLDFMKN